MLFPHDTQKGQAGTRGDTSTCGPDWTRLKFKFPRVPLRTNSFARTVTRGPERSVSLLDFYLGARIFKLLLDGGGFVLVDAFLDRLGRAVDQVLGFFQAQAGDF